MRTGTTRREKGTRAETVLHVAFELDDFHWTLTMGTGMRREPRQRQIRPRDRSAILGEIQDDAVTVAANARLQAQVLERTGRLRRLAREVCLAEERERRRIAEDLAVFTAQLAEQGVPLIKA